MIAYGQCFGRKFPCNQPLPKPKEPEKLRYCSRCKKHLPSTYFDRSDGTGGGYYKSCHACRTRANELRRK